MNVEKLKNDIISGYKIKKEEAFKLLDVDLEILCKCANQIREHFVENFFDMCTIINAKSGNCSENCKFCAQSSHYNTGISTYSILSEEEILKDAKYNSEKGVLRYSTVNSGRKPTSFELERICSAMKRVKQETKLKTCVSLGLLDREQLIKLKEAGITRIHNNIETSREYFPNVCTTHTFDDKIKTIEEAKKLGFSVCSGVILGLGESFEDRINTAFTLRDLEVKSIPVNMLNPIKNTPYENNAKLTQDEIRRFVAIFRFVNPDAYIRLAGGRILLEDKGEKCFLSGANATVSGDLLTTVGTTIDFDINMIEKLGYKIGIKDE
ncbi:biotin synthase BioB [[Clostridium] colinum]|uniref:biotin synthase BioB n=1 Tax=[Clostridium] colinum TaxID=36835 RepID=UPI0020256354|nr:biotin synthase BioB [[Clostridium] colinum]